MTVQSPMLDVALLHHPVVNKIGGTIGSAVTNLDLHDIARAARTFGVGHYYVATPYSDQHELVAEIVDHWQKGYGAAYNPARKDALSIIRAVYGLDDVVADMEKRHGSKPIIVATSARKSVNEISYEELRTHLDLRLAPVLLIFGTAHGLAPEVMSNADATLPPIYGRSAYNHLSVRSAVSIILDRLLGR